MKSRTLRIICVLSLTAYTGIVTPVYAASYVEHRHPFLRGIAKGVLRYEEAKIALHAGKAVVGAGLGVGAVLGGAYGIVGACSAMGCAPDALDQTRMFISQRPKAGEREMAHAMATEAKKHPEKMESLQNLADATGVHVNLKKSAEAEARAAARKKRTAELLAKAEKDFPGHNLKGGGDCEPDKHKILQNAVDILCKGKNDEGRSLAEGCAGVVRKSESEESVTKDWIEKVAKIRACRHARENIMNECYRGGDKNHTIELNNTINKEENCQSSIDNYLASRGYNTTGRIGN